MKRRLAATIFASILALIGVTLMWTGVYFTWAMWWVTRAGPDISVGSQEIIPVPAVGVIALHFLLPLGLLPALTILLGGGITAIILTYLAIRAGRS